MKKLEKYEDLIKLAPLSEFVLVDKKKFTVEKYKFLYAHHNNFFKDNHFYVTDHDLTKPKELYYNWTENELYVDTTYDDIKKLKDDLENKSKKHKKYNKYKNYHWAYIKGKLTYYNIDWNEKDIKDANYNKIGTIDDIESVLLEEPKFEDVKNMFGTLKNYLKVHHLEDRRLGYENMSGKYIHEIHGDDSLWDPWCYMNYEPEKKYKLYYYVTDDAEGYCYTHYIYVEELSMAEKIMNKL